MIDRRRLLRALDRRDVADWTLVERAQEVAIARGDLRRSEQRTKWHLTIHHDSPQGRGSAHIPIDSIDGDASVIVDDDRREPTRMAGAIDRDAVHVVDQRVGKSGGG